MFGIGTWKYSTNYVSSNTCSKNIKNTDDESAIVIVNLLTPPKKFQHFVGLETYVRHLDIYTVYKFWFLYDPNMIIKDITSKIMICTNFFCITVLN